GIARRAGRTRAPVWQAGESARAQDGPRNGAGGGSGDGAGSRTRRGGGPGVVTTDRPETPQRTPLVGIAMGSASDLPTLRPAAEVLERFGVAYEMRVLSAHRTPDAMAAYAGEAQGRGLRVLIAGAGGAAHLPGMLAANTVLPVIGVP